MEISDDVDPLRAWVGVLLAGALALVAGVLIAPRAVYDRFLWRYFWGPVDADAHGAVCAVRAGGTTERLYSQSACAAAEGVLAHPGYTTVSTVSYAVVLVFMLVGVLLVLHRLELEMTPRFFYALFPYMLLGGALRVVEDANATFLREGAGTLIPYPWVALIISPFIYFVMFAFTLTVLLLAVRAKRRGRLESFEPALGAVGAVALLATVALLGWVAATSPHVDFNPLFLGIVLVGATAIAAAFWWVSERYAPWINAGTGRMGILVVWGHSLDGLANVLSLDWGPQLVGVSYGSKHVINAAVVRLTGRAYELLGVPWLADAVGTAWPFLLLKVAAAVLVVWLFDDRIFEESPRYAYLLFIAILAVGLGPGSRDTLRATLGI